MTAPEVFCLFGGTIAGGMLGYVTAWRFARKLEHHGVALWKWDRHWDAQATPDNLEQFRRPRSS